MSIATNQQRTFLRLLAALRPHWRRDPALPGRIQSLLARERAFGSRDRRLYRELIYTALRYLPWIEPLLDPDAPEAVRRLAWFAADVPATKAFRAAFATGDPPAGDPAELLPPWFRPHCPELFTAPEATTQLRRAPLWTRLQTPDAAAVFVELEKHGWPFRASPVLPSAVEILADADVTKTESWRSGQIEIQDLGSQLLLETIGISPGGNWLDACAGAGGKTLQLAHLLGPTGHIDAYDIRADALQELEARARRAGIRLKATDARWTSASHPPNSSQSPSLPAAASAASISTHPTTPPSSACYDGVLIDAPCSGSGTWRRAPHLKWTTTDSTVARAADLQATLLRQFSGQVRPGGRLVYATCSLSSHENEDVVNRFLAETPAFQPEPFARTFNAQPRGPGVLILPGLHDTDGFYVASLRRQA